MIFQTFNKKTKAWVKFKKMASGKTTILDVKQRLPKVPFKGFSIKKAVKRASKKK